MNRKLHPLLFPFVLTLAFVACLSGCSAGAGTVSTNDGDMKKQTVSCGLDDSVSASMEIPRSWEVEDGEDGLLTITPDEFDGMVMLGLDIYPLSDFGNDQELLDFWAENLDGVSSDWTLISSKSDSVPTYLTSVDIDGNKEPKGYLVVSITGDSSVGAELIAAKADWSKAKPILMDVAKSFEVDRKDAPNYGGSSNSNSDNKDTKSDLGSNEASPVASYSAGSYRVGKDIPSGEYKITCSSRFGYYCVYPDSSKGDVLSNGNFNTCTYVTVSDGQLLEVTGASFVAIADAKPTSTLSGEGIYKVGLDIQPGEYNITAQSGSGYYAVLSAVDANESFNIINNDNFEGNSFVTVADGQYLEISGAAIETS